MFKQNQIQVSVQVQAQMFVAGAGMLERGLITSAFCERPRH